MDYVSNCDIEAAADETRKLPQLINASKIYGPKEQTITKTTYLRAYL